MAMRQVNTFGERPDLVPVVFLVTLPLPISEYLWKDPPPHVDGCDRDRLAV